MATVALASCGGDDEPGSSTSGSSTSGTTTSGSSTSGTTTNSLSAEGAELVDGLTSQQVVDCLKAAGAKNDFTVSESEADLDRVAKGATEHAVALDLNGSKAMVIMQRTEQEADKVITDYRAGPDSERAVAFAQARSIIVAYKAYDVPESQSNPIGACTEYGLEP